MGRPARRYKYRVDVFNYIAQPDGYGGNIATQSTLLATVWADAEILPREKLIDFGLDEAQEVVRLHVRKGPVDYYRNDIAFGYGSYMWRPFNVAERTPGVEFEILAGSIE